MCSSSLAVGRRSCSWNVYTLFVKCYHCTVCCVNHGILIVLNKRPLATSSTANLMASSEMRFFNLSTVRPETQTPALLNLKMVILHVNLFHLSSGTNPSSVLLVLPFLTWFCNLPILSCVKIPAAFSSPTSFQARHHHNLDHHSSRHFLLHHPQTHSFWHCTCDVCSVMLIWFPEGST